MKQAPEFIVQKWINADQPITLASLRGKVVIAHAFQMLCPACTYHAIPQTARLHKAFANEPNVAVLGLHTVFEHHDVMNERGLSVFVKENKLQFPIGIDEPSTDGPEPQTMTAYQMKGTPTLLLIDRQGMLRIKHFGTIDDFALGLAIGKLLGEAVGTESIKESVGAGCAIK